MKKKVKCVKKLRGAAALMYEPSLRNTAKRLFYYFLFKNKISKILLFFQNFKNCIIFCKLDGSRDGVGTIRTSWSLPAVKPNIRLIGIRAQLILTSGSYKEGWLTKNETTQ